MSAPMPSRDVPAGPPASKTAYALDRLRSEIANGSLRPGEALRQADLAKRFGISPTPVREALRLLEAEGTISYAPHRGATVVELEPQRVEDLYLLRAATESLATRLAVQRMKPATLAAVQDSHERLLAAGRGAAPDGSRLAAWNRELHLQIYAAGSPLVTSCAKGLWRMFPPRITMWRAPEMVGTLLDQHEAIMRAVVAGDAEGASALMSDHIMTAARYRLRKGHPVS